ncbi:MAG: YkgJ family cysteine cluster protein [Epsilonproteobacteria bacterium]|jgi:Fe-S-cluster containining protein|nr:YkgJ family cysteine cluster protein [Campylobacterota bacterium]
MNTQWITQEGYDFAFNPHACDACGGACCTGSSGYIWVKYEEIRAIASLLDLEVDEFAFRFLKKVNHRYSIIEKQIATDNFACIFFENGKCNIYEARPRQCRTFPFWEQFKNNIQEVKQECQGII